MASEIKNAKAEPAPKKEVVAAEKSTPDTTPAKAEGSEKAAPAPASYSRGEGQKPVTQAYKDNWNAIFGDKPKKPAKKKKR